eukprot:14306919-Ditylum_brightwellii.AAC.1
MTSARRCGLFSFQFLYLFITWASLMVSFKDGESVLDGVKKRRMFLVDSETDSSRRLSDQNWSLSGTSICKIPAPEAFLAYRQKR